MRARDALRVWLLSTACVLLGCQRGSDLPVIATAPPLALTDQDGVAFDSKRLAGKIWIANFIFTSCPDVCPMLTSKMRSLQVRFFREKQHVELVSISVDPEVDTPEVLKRFAQDHEADLSNWSFLTGKREVVREIVMQGFKQAMEDAPPPGDGPRNILHGSHVALVDKRGQIRGFYRTENSELLKLTQDAARLLKESP